MKFFLSSLAGVVAFAAGLAGSTMLATAQSESDGIVVYNAQHESLTQAWADGFTKETGIKVTLRNGSDMEFANQIVQEGAASPADVYLTENSPGMALVDKANLFEALNADTLAQVPGSYRP
ncbi:MAG TPA: extracellular solute-binding protein, partial [Phyllobacterium sp.]|nr:extracellular solute-binding protein [Phyllobacterium sp.]